MRKRAAGAGRDQSRRLQSDRRPGTSRGITDEVICRLPPSHPRVDQRQMRARQTLRRRAGGAATPHELFKPGTPHATRPVLVMSTNSRPCRRSSRVHWLCPVLTPHRAGLTIAKWQSSVLRASLVMLRIVAGSWTLALLCVGLTATGSLGQTQYQRPTPPTVTPRAGGIPPASPR